MAKKTEWLKDTVRGKIINVDRPGENIEMNVNGFALFYADSVICDVPKAVIAAIDDAVTYIYENGQNVNIDAGETPKKVPHRPYRFYPEGGESKKPIHDKTIADIHALREAEEDEKTVIEQLDAAEPIEVEDLIEAEG